MSEPIAVRRNRQREQLILALLQQPGIEKAAAAVGISSVTAWRIMKTPEHAAEPPTGAVDTGVVAAAGHRESGGSRRDFERNGLAHHEDAGIQGGVPAGAPGGLYPISGAASAGGRCGHIH